MKFSEQQDLPQKKLVNNALQETTKTVEDIASLPIEYAKVVRNQTTHLDSEIRKRAIYIIRRWVDYVAENNVDKNNPFLIRYHLTLFAEKVFGREREKIDLQEVDIEKVVDNGETYSRIINTYVSNEIVNDNHVALIGGVARLGLKMHAGVSFKDELPINDVDVIISTDVNIPETAKKYNVDLTGAKVVDGEISLAIQRLITNFDSTMNQVAVYNGKLIFPEKALEDIREGNIRIIAKDDPLFGSEGEVIDDGNVYLNRVGFYRGLSFLVRGKGARLIVSKENIEMEKGNIGRYWLVMLYVKILPMKNIDERKKAIAHWHEIAKRIGSTETNNPEEFLKELKVSYPEMNARGQDNQEFDIENQIRWIIGKLATKATKEVFEKEHKQLPVSYTESNLMLADQVREYDYDSFMNVVMEK
jgi:hypothetical protein